MKKHEELRHKANAYANVADYIDTLIEDEKRNAKHYEDLATEAKLNEDSDEQYFLEQKEIYELKAKIYKALYDMICKEVK